ncbi:MAG: tetraacyldisaccharide 4'-kinase [Bacteroidaceae bacterium]|nr:tetraacyldisaccharide 4'-kinase [Bacteroidaceae bacterium]
MKPEFRINNILRPLGWLYGLITGIRNLLYDKGLKKSTAFPFPVISIGNITVGGTGKTPHAEYTAILLKDRFKTAVLSRGYGRHTKGFFMSDAHSDSGLIGDEPLQIKRRFPDLEVAVCNDRAKGINRLTAMCAPQVIILDDAFQHRRITPSLNILLVNWHRNILDDAMLPAGHLRENPKGRRRADIIIVTKCPEDLDKKSIDAVAQRLKVRPDQQVYFSTPDYSQPYLIDDSGHPLQLPKAPVLAVTGIVFPALMKSELERQGHQVVLMDYPDHHRFSKQDIANITDHLEGLGPDAIIVTTAKDAARLSDLDLEESLRKRIYVLPVGVRFLRDAAKFEKAVIGHVESFGKKKTE